MPDTDETQTDNARGRGRPKGSTKPEDERSERSETVYLRIPERLMRRVEAHRETMSRAAETGVLVSRSGAIHNLIGHGLDAVYKASEPATTAHAAASPKAAPKRRGAGA